AQKEYDEARARLASTLRIARLADTGGAFSTFFVRDNDMKALRRQALAEKLATVQARELAAVQKARDRAVTLEFVAGMERAQTWALNRVSEEAIVKLEQETARRRALLKQINEDVETMRRHASELSDAERDMVRTIRSRLGSGAAPGDFQALAGKLRVPLTDGQVLVPFGDVIHPRFKTSTPHPGWTIGFDSKGPRNVRSIAFGRVVWTGRMRGFGNTVVVDHASGWYSVYAGLSSLETVEKAIVREGDVVGRVSAHPGESKVTMYFELRRDSNAVDPADYIDATLAEPETDR
ncbi:MAG TPA: peptidoglycan DD-metalloendopeptidase family protein, partial [Myxococcota bacterium]|nr:peptidoglycan DD-metalloendopeptidase family protein [Myxococcota bacterium]